MQPGDAAKSMIIRSFDRSDTEAVVRLWQDCQLTRPWNDPHRDIERKLDDDGELFLVGTHEGTIIASVMAGYDGHRGWIYYLAVAPASQRSSCGRQLMDEVERRLLERGCAKINLMVRASNAAVKLFYAKLGYVQDEVIALGKRLIVDSDPKNT
jgi:ribosomal protein S18 acetylase RimI-like enzyme